MKLPQNIGKSQLRRRILSYLAKHPQAADTIEGIAQWWLKDPPLHPTNSQLQAALDKLAAERFVLARSAGNGHVSYSMNREKQAEIRRLVKAPF